MCDLPGEVGDPKEGMTNPSNTVVEIWVRGKCPMATLVSQNPNTSKNQPLGKAVSNPERRTDYGRLDANVQDTIDEGDRHSDVAQEI